MLMHGGNEDLLILSISFFVYVVCLDPASAAATQASREEVDSRSVFVGNVSF